jgi:hypothetical protein
MQSSITFSQALYSEIVSKGSLVEGENGALAQSATYSITNTKYSDEDYYGILSEVFLLMRSDNTEKINRKLDKVNNVINTLDRVLEKEKYIDYMTKFIKICLFMREPRKGKGEKKIFYDIIIWFWKNYNNVGRFFINHLKDFGYFADLCNLYNLGENNNEIKKYLVEVYGNQLIKDRDVLLTNPSLISLAGKWAPREQSKYKQYALDITKKFFNKNKKEYRQLIVSLNKQLNVPEVNMCQKQWSSIDFKNVSSKALSNYTKAFQDITVNPFPKSKRKSKYIKDVRRHQKNDSDYEDREKCRNNLQEHVEKGGKINSGVTDLSKIIEKYLHGLSEDMIWEAQWTQRVNEIQELLKNNNYKPSILPMIDLSSSMTGDPMINAITLGFFCSMLLDNPLNEPEAEYANMFLTFNTVPEIGKLPRLGTLYSKIKSLTDNGWMQKWGGTTDVQLAIKMILDIAIKHKISKEKMPNVLAIFSDMQFNQGDRKWNETSYETMARKYMENGYEIPHIIFWNLRADTNGYQVLANTPNTTMLSGYSTRMMDLFLTSSIEELKKEASIVKNEKTSPTTLSLMENIYTHTMFDNFNDEIKQLFV